MKNQNLINNVIADIAQRRSIDPLTDNAHYPHIVKNWLDTVRDDLVNDLHQAQKRGQVLLSDDDQARLISLFEQLDDLLQQHNEQTTPLTKDDLKTVHKLLQERKLHPSGEFDSKGRFYLDDSPLVSVRSPSARFPYTQMMAGRSLKFVKALVDTYKPQSLDELMALFVKAD